MKNIFLSSLLVIAASSAQAGYQKLTCTNKNKTITFSDEGHIEIKYIKDGKPQTMTGDSQIKPWDDKTIVPLAFIYPLNGQKHVSAKCEQMHVKHVDGTECDGREQWSIRSTRPFLIISGNGNNLFNSIDKVDGKTEDGFIHDTFTCLDEGVTSPGGCRVVDEKDQYEWRSIPCVE